MKTIVELYKKYRELVWYVICGGMTTLVNIVSYGVCADILGIHYLVSNFIAWVISVLFAYITNKLYVFESRGNTAVENIKELFLFFAARILTLGLDMASLSFCLEILETNDFIAKFVSQFIVILSNYIFSKLIIFKKAK